MQEQTPADQLEAAQRTAARAIKAATAALDKRLHRQAQLTVAQREEARARVAAERATLALAAATKEAARTSTHCPNGPETP